MRHPIPDKPDVCVIGTGPAGLAAASLLGAAGRTVLLIESGPNGPSTAAQRLNDGDHEGIGYAGLMQTRHRQVGGTVNVWNVEFGDVPGAKYAPLSPCDMVDWPLGFDALRPFYERAQALCGLGPFEYGADHWATPARPPFPLDGTGLTSAVYQFGTAAQLNRRLVDSLPEAVTLAPSMTVVELLTARGPRRVAGLRAVDAQGRTHEVRPRTLVVACGAVESARLLLLNDEIRRAELPWLGRGFMEHARDFSLRLTPDSTDLFERAAFYDLHQGADGTWIGGRLALTDAAMRDLNLPNAGVTLIPRTRPTRLGRMLRALRLAGAGGRQRRYGWSEPGSRRTRFDDFKLVVNVEQRPDRSNRIELGSRRDRFGNPLPRLFLQWTAPEQAGLERLRGKLREWTREAGLGRLHVVEGTRPDLNAHHHAGTTRMAESAHDGVVDSNGRLFGFDGLYLTGASVFPTAGFANPTLTIVAMALRQAQHVDAVLG